jgi:hypothetical protein
MDVITLKHPTFDIRDVAAALAFFLKLVDGGFLVAKCLQKREGKAIRIKPLIRQFRYGFFDLNGVQFLLPPLAVFLPDRSSIQFSKSLRRTRHGPPTLKPGVTPSAARRPAVFSARLR